MNLWSRVFICWNSSPLRNDTCEVTVCKEFHGLESKQMFHYELIQRTTTDTSYFCCIPGSIYISSLLFVSWYLPFHEPTNIQWYFTLRVDTKRRPL